MTTDHANPPPPALPSRRLLSEPARSGGRFVSLQTKLLVGTLLVVASVMTALVIIVEHRQREAIIREVQKRGDTLARDLAVASTGPLVLYDYTQLEQNVARVATETDVAYAMILDRDGRVAAHNHRPEMVGTLLSGATLDRILSTDATVAQELNEPDGEALYDFAVPIRVDAQRWGTARVGLSRHRMEAEIAATRRQLVLLAVLVLAGAGLASALVARRIARPVRQLAAGAVAISGASWSSGSKPRRGTRSGSWRPPSTTWRVSSTSSARRSSSSGPPSRPPTAELRRRFAELSDLKSYTDHILDSLFNGIVTVDLDGRVLFVNGAASSAGLPGRDCPRPVT